MYPVLFGCMYIVNSHWEGWIPVECMWWEENRKTQRKPLEQGKETTKDSTDMTVGPGFEPGLHWRG